MYVRHQHARARVCVCVCEYVYTGMFPILDCTGQVVESCGTYVSRTMFVVRKVWPVSSEAWRGAESARGSYLIIMEWSPNTSMYTQVRIYLCMCICARTRQDFEYQLQAADAESVDIASEASIAGAAQDQRGTATYNGKVFCVMCCGTPVIQ